jgi:hypothetical protein
LALVCARFDDLEDVMSQSRTKTFSLKALAVLACALTAVPAITIPTPAEAQVYRGRAFHSGPGWGGRQGFGPRPGFAVRQGFAGPRFGGGRRFVGGSGFAARPIYRPVYGGYRGGFGYRPFRPAYARPYYRPVYAGSYGYPYYGGYRSYGYGYPYYGGGYYRSYDNSGAVVAGLIGGLALGAIAANAAARPAYRTARFDNCFFERRRVVTRSGNAIVRRVRTCY